MSKGGKGGSGAQAVSVPSGPYGLYADASQGYNAGTQAMTQYVPLLNNLTQWASSNALTGGSGGNLNLQQANDQILYGKNLETGTNNWADQMAGQGNALYAKGNQLYQDATTGTGLFPSQQAMVNQAQNAEQTQVASQLGAEGLASSTAAPVLQGEVAQQAAATAGQLEQGNLQLAQSQYQLANAYQQSSLGGQQLNMQQQTALEQEAQGLQNQSWTQALNGYGTLGQMIQTALQGFGVSINANTEIEQASISTAQDQAGLAGQQASASGNAMSGLGMGLGQILGGSGGGSGGGLLGSLGGLFGGAGGAAGGAGGSLAGSGGAALGEVFAGSGAADAAGAAGGAAAAGGGSSLFTAAGVLFAA